ncbi:MAG: LpqB family beta-propeller domain-containing protein [Pseudomonadota bacterium]
MLSGGNVDSFKISPDGSRVVYAADQDTRFIEELYSVPITGGSVTKLNPALVAGGDVQGPSSSIEISADGNRVLYVADQDTNDVYELYSSPITGGAVVKLNSALVIGGDVSPFNIQISPDSSRAVYLADQEQNDINELFSVPITGGIVTKLNPALVAGGRVYSNFQISADGSRVVYLSDQDTRFVNELYSVPLLGGAVTKLNSGLINGGDVLDFEISADGSHVVYSADQETNSVAELYSVPITGGAVTKLNPTLIAGDGVRSFEISANSSRVAYRADQDTRFIDELYSVPVTGGAVTKLNSALVRGGEVSAIQISPDGSRVVYRADQDTENVDELYSVPIGGGIVTRLNAALVSGGDVAPLISSFRISADASRVVYIADQDTDEVDELYSAAQSTCPAAGFPASSTLCLENFDGIQSWESQAGSQELQQTITFLNSSKKVVGVSLELRGLRHTASGNISVRLVAPDGTEIDLTTYDINGTSSYQGLYRFEDSGADLFAARNQGPNAIVSPDAYAPHTGNQTNNFVETFEGISASGKWTLVMRDNAAGNDGSLSNWRLVLLTVDGSIFKVIPTANGKAAIVEL